MSASGAAKAPPQIIDNGYAKIRVSQDVVQVIGWYTPPWLCRLSRPLTIFLYIPLFWIALRAYLPDLTNRFSPGIDRALGAFVDLFRQPFHGWLADSDFSFGRGMTLSVILATIAAWMIMLILIKLFVEQGWDMFIFSHLVRFPLRVEITKKHVKIGRRTVPRERVSGFSSEPPIGIKSGRGLHQAYHESLTIILEMDNAKIPIATVFGLRRAEGLVLALESAKRIGRKP